MFAHIAVGICLLSLFSSSSFADQWRRISKFEFASENKQHLLKIEPHERWVDKPGHCLATLYRVDGEEHIELWSRFLINNHAPVRVFVSNSGDFVVTMDEWHRVGKLPFVIYGPKGKLICVHSTDSLGLRDDIEHIKRTVSSYWWNENSINFFGPKEEVFYIRLHWGKILLLKLSNGDLMDDDWYELSKGWSITEEKWNSLHDFAKRHLIKLKNATSQASDE
ncbi:hypothetical protein N9153_01370 [Planctomicrobium sp.]|nr:hypothetical protein [Planctomicrobium sp.]